MGTAAASSPSGDLRNYALVTGAYWADTLADGASRMLVLFYFFELGYSPIEVASLFLFYEVFGIVTNLVGGWVFTYLIVTGFSSKESSVAKPAIEAGKHYIDLGLG